MTRNIFLMLVSACLLYGCIGADMSESEVVLATDQTEIIAPAEFLADGDNTRTIVIRSNRSWFAHLDDLDHPIDPADPDARVGWASLSVERHQNLTNTTDETEVVITFNKNYSSEDMRGVLNIYCEGKVMRCIPVTQQGIIFYLAVQAETQVAQCDADTITVNIDCNTLWTAAMSDASTADVKLDVSKGMDSGVRNVIFAENFSTIENKTAEIIFSAKGCEDYHLTISQNKAVPYIQVLPEYDGRVLGGEEQALVKIRTNAEWTAEVVESELDDFTIVNPNGQKGISEPQEVKVTFKSNDSGNPFTIKTAKIRFTAEGMDEPVVYEFRQRGCLVVSFEDMSAFTPEIPNSLVSASGQPSNMSRPGKINTDVDIFKFTSSAKYPDKDEYISVDLEMSQYIRYDTNSSSLYIFGAGKLPHIKFSGIEGLTIEKITMACTGAGWFAGNIVSEEHVLASKTTPAYTEYITQESWAAPSDSGLHYIDFDLSEKGLAIGEGQGCTLRTSDKNGTNDTSNKTRMYIKSVTFKYL